MADRPPTPSDVDTVLTLPESLRDELKGPFGPVYADADALVADAGDPTVAVGDVVTYHLVEAGHRPAVAIVDGRTEREVVADPIRDRLAGLDGERHPVVNPAGELTAALLTAVRAAMDASEPVIVTVDGEEDLAAVAAIAAAPADATIVYGQPGEGMVAVDPDADDARDRAVDILDRMDGDPTRARSLLDS
ncbi:DUF359 domain-containing protein [Halobacteriales archaeon SW_7_68_16]|nr:MAG: DUF359 domain-containing protein [Halobacteriales archaeon SW_7_68_16]